ncbi:hypothetical protein F3P66_11970 [Agrobacterium fabrum]|uniref:Uncharacterized protein n=1 Tax=Agrobacterium fabrum (strain C58 / ATCC 33970) TaxID=176299 RepID=Q7D1C2_AGRFC|nr:hypothetical protein Atu0500 [Agrobacterium fabrum str. C58]QKW95771.1 hypothetical protein GSF67_00820 [Agrobacterium sp. CGMCC 11546]QRM60075.1 hypothetical protein F3P66_11970 [Agrobacterium fabrum]TRB31515.1 hypothetical protein EXN51_05115 [Agrobacterium fabrum]
MVRLSASRDDLSLGCWVFDRNPFIFSLASLPPAVPGFLSRRCLSRQAVAATCRNSRAGICPLGGKCAAERSSYLLSENSRNVVKKWLTMVGIF